MRHADYITLSSTRLHCSFTRICVTTHWCLAGGRRSRRNTLAGTAISGKAGTVSACTLIAAKCVHTRLGAWLLLPALVHVWSGNKDVRQHIKDTPVVVQVKVHLCVYLFGIDNPSNQVGRRIGWVVHRYRHSHMVSHTRLQGIVKLSHILRDFLIC